MHTARITKQYFVNLDRKPGTSKKRVPDQVRFARVSINDFLFDKSFHE